MHIFLSPHLDDAVFSCGGHMALLAQAGEPVRVVTIFSDAPLRPGDIRPSDLRIREDAQAASVLGFAQRLLGGKDVSLRGRSSLRTVFLSKERVEDLALVTSLLAEHVVPEPGDTLYVPLGVGRHVDHLLVFQAARRLFSQMPLRYYEDAPYLFVPHLLHRRLEALGGVPGRRHPPVREAIESARFYRRSGVMRERLGPWAPLSEPVLAVWFLRALALHDVSPVRLGPLAPTVVDIASVLKKKVGAMLCYASQFELFWKGAGECVEMHEAYGWTLERTHAIVERYWTHV